MVEAAEEEADEGARESRRAAIASASGRGGRGRGRRGGEREPTRRDRLSESSPRDRLCEARPSEETQDDDERRARASERGERRRRDEADASESDGDRSDDEKPRSALNALKRAKRRKRRLRYGERVVYLVDRRAPGRSSLDAGRDAPVAATPQRLKRVRRGAEKRPSKALGEARYDPNAPFTTLSYRVASQTGRVDVANELKLVAGSPAYAQDQRIEAELNFIDGVLMGDGKPLAS